MIEDNDHCFETSSEQFGEEFHLVEILSIVDLKFGNDATDRVNGSMLLLEKQVELEKESVDPANREKPVHSHRNHRRSNRSRCLHLRTLRDPKESSRDRPSIFENNAPNSTTVAI